MKRLHMPLLLLQVGLHLGKNTARYASQLKVVAPQHPMALRAEAGEELFDRAAAAMA
jgi:coatomer protein complex subunit epsilon